MRGYIPLAHAPEGDGTTEAREAAAEAFSLAELLAICCDDPEPDGTDEPRVVALRDDIRALMAKHFDTLLPWCPSAHRLELRRLVGREDVQ